MPPSPDPPIPKYVNNFALQTKIGSGYSGYIFRAQHIHSGQVVALKLQRLDHETPTNRYERYLYPLLQGGEGMPILWASGEQKPWDFLAMELLGSSLDSLIRHSKKDCLDVRTVCTIAMQLISRLETMHSRGVLHRDIQMANCTVGLPPNDKLLYMIDFGFSKRYIDPKTRRHIPDSRAKRDFIGNYWFSSVNVHCRGRVPSRRDDLEAVALMLIHLLTPRGLVWTRNGIPKDEDEHDRLKLLKSSATPSQLCRNLPEEFEDLLKYCRKLKFAEQPDYATWIERFRDLSLECGGDGADNFIWPPVTLSEPTPLPTQKSQKSETPRRIHQSSVAHKQYDDILRNLGKLNVNDLLGNTRIGDRKNIEAAVEQLRGGSSQTQQTSEDLQSVERIGQNKVAKLVKLTSQLRGATNNDKVADLVQEFTAVLQSNTSRTITKDAFKFLEGLTKQLADPSVFEAQDRVRGARSQRQEDDGQLAKVKLNLLAGLRTEVRRARSNGELGALVEDFSRITNRSSAKTITKDGFAFLEGLVARLRGLA